jgi:hypothetical protein
MPLNRWVAPSRPADAGDRGPGHGGRGVGVAEARGDVGSGQHVEQVGQVERLRRQRHRADQALAGVDQPAEQVRVTGHDRVRVLGSAPGGREEGALQVDARQVP